MESSINLSELLKRLQQALDEKMPTLGYVVSFRESISKAELRLLYFHLEAVLTDHHGNVVRQVIHFLLLS